MRPHAYIVLLLAVHARAASIQLPTAEKKLPATPEEPIKEVIPLENVSSEQELLDSSNTIKDVENNLRVKAVDSIPVKVIVDPVDDDDSNLKRVEVDLNNPGEPQRQEHDSQSPESFNPEQQIIASVKKTVSDTQYALKQGFQGVSQGLQDWISNNEQLGSIQESIQGLQQSFTSQITKLNETLQSYWNNQGSGDKVPSDQKQKPEFNTVENNLKNLENNFEIGVKALSEGVHVFATLRADPEKPATSPPNNLFIQYVQLFQQTVSQGFNNVTQAFQNYVGQNSTENNGTNSGIFQGINSGIQNIFGQGGPGGDAQSDEGAPQKPTIWQGIQQGIQNILNPQTQSSAVGQGGQAPLPAPPGGPLVQAIQNNPFVQGVVNFIQPNKPAAQQPQPNKPATQPEKPAEAPAGSNAVPAETKPESDTQQPAKETEQPAATSPITNNGPIRNIIQNNPIVKGISGAVQKLQTSISGNPEQPRDTVKEEGDATKSDAKGHGEGSGDNNDCSGVNTEVEPEKVEEPIPEEPKEQVPEEKKVLEKTDKTETS